MPDPAPCAPPPASQRVVAFQAVLSPREKSGLRRRFWSGVTFKRVDFSGADFRLSRFDSVTFHQCDLTNADFRGAELKRCRFERCDLAALKVGRNMLVDTEFRSCRHLLAEQRQRILSMGGRWVASLRE